MHCFRDSSWNDLESFINKFDNGLFEAVDDMSHAFVIEGLGQIRGSMIVRVSEISRVRDHHGRISFFPECPVVRKINAGDKTGRNKPRDGKIGSSFIYLILLTLL